jgi:hypothetical protein
LVLDDNLAQVEYRVVLELAGTIAFFGMMLKPVDVTSHTAATYSFRFGFQKERILKGPFIKKEPLLQYI